MLVEDEVEPVNSDEDNRDGGEEDADRLGTGHNLADDVHEHVVLRREGEVEADHVQDNQGHGQDAQDAYIADEAKDDQDTVHDYDDVVCQLVQTKTERKF